MNTWLQKATAYVEPQIQKTCEEGNSILSKYFMRIVRGEEQWLEKCLFIPYPHGSGEVKALCKTQCSPPLSRLWPGLLSFLKNFYVKLKDFLVAASTLKCV